MIASSDATVNEETEPSRPQTISFRADVLNSRGIVGARNPGRFAATTWWSRGDSNCEPLYDA
jgi:hypothetical protein